MNTFLNLSMISGDGSVGILINVSQICSIESASNPRHKERGINTLITVSNRETFEIQETLTEIFNKLKEIK